MSDDKNTTENQVSAGDDPWRRWKVKPIPEAMLADPKESGIGKRIAFCRGQLDNLSVDALARYTRFFDEEGVSRSSLVRYEAGVTLPGARELRILCDALWVTPNWLLFGKLEADTTTGFGQAVENALSVHLEKLGIGGAQRMPKDANLTREAGDYVQRQQWIDQARKA